MKSDDSGKPAVGVTSGRVLGARPCINADELAPGTDILVRMEWVRAQDGGMSVCPDDPSRMNLTRRPVWINGGRSPDPLWSITEDQLGEQLMYVPDPNNPNGHGYVAPSRDMSFDEYQRALESTRDSWQRVDTIV